MVEDIFILPHQICQHPAGQDNTYEVIPLDENHREIVRPEVLRDNKQESMKLPYLTQLSLSGALIFYTACHYLQEYLMDAVKRAKQSA